MLKTTFSVVYPPQTQWLQRIQYVFLLKRILSIPILCYFRCINYYKIN